MSHRLARDLASELSAFRPEERRAIAELYAAMGWASHADLVAAVGMLEGGR